MRFKYCPNCSLIYHEDARVCALPQCKGDHEWFPPGLEYVEDSTPPDERRGPQGGTGAVRPQ